jgi:broad-specificity NMP kinase
MVNGNRGYSLNKIDSNKQSAKIDVIKLKCFQTSKLQTKYNSKQMTNEKELEGD